MIDGKPWFPAVDVGTVLGFALKTISSNMRRALKADEFQTVRRNVTGSQLDDLFHHNASVMTLISESGLYKFLNRAQRRPGIRDFQDWVTREVLPRIRRDGAYIMGEEKVGTGEMSFDQFMEKMPFVLNQKARQIEKELDAFKKGLISPAPTHRVADAAKIFVPVCGLRH